MQTWLVENVPLNVNFVLSKPLLGAAAVLSQIVTNALFASQLLQWNVKFKLLTMFLCVQNMKAYELALFFLQ